MLVTVHSSTKRENPLSHVQLTYHTPRKDKTLKDSLAVSCSNSLGYEGSMGYSDILMGKVGLPIRFQN